MENREEFFESGDDAIDSDGERPKIGYVESILEHPSVKDAGKTFQNPSSHQELRFLMFLEICQLSASFFLF